MSDKEEMDELTDLVPLRGKGKGNVPLQVSGWDDDDDGIEEERNPHGSDKRRMLWAAENGHLDELIELLKTNSSLLQVTDKDGYTPLHRACYNDHVDIVKFLLKAGARHDALTNDKWQPLHSACRWNNVKCASMLLSYGANVNAKSQGGVTPLHLAAGHRVGKSMIELLLSHPELINNVKDTSGDTPLDLALRLGNNHTLFETFESCFL